jgi:hypothetical protein
MIQNADVLLSDCWRRIVLLWLIVWEGDVWWALTTLTSYCLWDTNDWLKRCVQISAPPEVPASHRIVTEWDQRTQALVKKSFTAYFGSKKKSGANIPRTHNSIRTFSSNENWQRKMSAYKVRKKEKRPARYVARSSPKRLSPWRGGRAWSKDIVD